MKKVFVLYTCFCLLISQNVFSIDVAPQVQAPIIETESPKDDTGTTAATGDILEEKPETESPTQVDNDSTIFEEIESARENTITEKAPDDTSEQVEEVGLDKLPDVQVDTLPLLQHDPIENDEIIEIKKNKPPEKFDESKNTTSAIYTDVRINEILPNPDGPDATNEFIELYNYGNDDISLKGWQLYDKTGITKLSKRYIFDDVVLKPANYLVLYNKKDFKFTLNNTKEEIFLAAPDDTMISHHKYKASTSGLSWNFGKANWYKESPTPKEENLLNPLTKEYPQVLINELLPRPADNESENEFIELYNPTEESVSLKNWILKDASKTGKYIFDDVSIKPGDYLVIYRTKFKFALNNTTETLSLIAPNTKTISTISYTKTQKGLSLNRDKSWYFAEISPGKKNFDNPKTKTYPRLYLNEILPNPAGDEKTQEFIEIYNPNNIIVDLKYWLLKDASKTGSFTFMNSALIQPRSYFVIYRKDFKFALNNTNETVYLIAPNEKVISTTTYKTSAKENVSYNFESSTSRWRWSKHMTPAAQNIFNNLPQITKFNVDKKVYKNVYAEFEAKATDIDGEKLKVRWDFGDGHKSYIWKTRHKYSQTGIYHGTLRIQDDSEEVTKNFTITVKKYPKHNVVITKIVPNPAGKDSGVEYIQIKNKSKKKLNLKNWSIATGSSKKTLVNHPIKKKLIIKPGKTKVITKKYTAISLPNKIGVIEIRRPNGKASDTKKYGAKEISIPDNASYEKIDGIWQWIIPKDLEKITQTNAIIGQALANEQILSQQKIESLIAYRAIHTPTESKTSQIDIRKPTFEVIAQYINKLLNETIATLHAQQNKKAQESIYNFPLYKIPPNAKPCEQPSLYRSDKLHFCK